ncbi:MAG TPA: GIY-YIG nuclease family protein [Ignavibacteria bacterium]|jgi:putative endonuclease
MKFIPGWVYILKCSDNSYYVGSTTNLVNRMNEHINGVYKGYTSKRLPIELVYSQSFNDMRDAIKKEQQIKGWTRKKKEALINGNIKLLNKLAVCQNETNYKNYLV